MNVKTVILLLAVAALTMGCGKEKKDFQMTVEQVDELKGLILKGISISGTVTSGCIATEDEMVITRDGKPVLKTMARVVNVRGTENTDSFSDTVFSGDYVSLYIPDGKKEDVKPGDMVTSHATSCDPSRGKDASP